jgi:hypothetical protein
VKGILKTWDIWNDKGAMYLYPLPTILEEACVTVNHTFLQKMQQGVKYQFDISQASFAMKLYMLHDKTFI